MSQKGPPRPHGALELIFHYFPFILELFLGPLGAPLGGAPRGALGPPYFPYLGLLLLLTTAATMAKSRNTNY